jgi:hypothetical protein
MKEVGEGLKADRRKSGTGSGDLKSPQSPTPERRRAVSLLGVGNGRPAGRRRARFMPGGGVFLLMERGYSNEIPPWAGATAGLGVPVRPKRAWQGTVPCGALGVFDRPTGSRRPERMFTTGRILVPRNACLRLGGIRREVNGFESR